MADLQSSVVTDQDTRIQIQQQIITWEENLERLHCEQFRLRCYMASLQCGELPNPKVSLSPPQGAYPLTHTHSLSLSCSPHNLNCSHFSLTSHALRRIRWTSWASLQSHHSMHSFVRVRHRCWIICSQVVEPPRDVHRCYHVPTADPADVQCRFVYIARRNLE